MLSTAVFLYTLSFSLQIDFDISGNWAEPIVYGSLDDWSANLKTILDWSPFTSKEDLMLQVNCILLYIHGIFSPNKITHGSLPFPNNINQFLRHILSVSVIFQVAICL
jgi:hypothetical protein